MDLLSMYYYAGTPVLLCNIICYSITTLSTSISSSQNVFKFISEHVEPDCVIFNNFVENNDLNEKLKILKSFILDVLSKYCDNWDEFEMLKKEIEKQTFENLNSICCKMDDYIIISNKNIISSEDVLISNDDNAIINLNNNVIEILDRIDEPIKLAIVSLSQIVYEICILLENTQNKITEHKKSFMKNLITLILKNEISKLNKLCKILELRSKMLFDLVLIYKK